MHIQILGTAQDAGVPQLFCVCPNCDAARQRPARARTASSVAIIDEGQAWLLDASPDLRLQAGELLRSTPLDGIFITHQHAGHIAGLLQLGEEGPARALDVWAPPRLARVLASGAPFANVFTRVRLHDWPLSKPVRRGRVTFTAHEIEHRGASAETIAVEAEAAGRRVLYLPDTDAWDDHVARATSRLGTGDVLVFDATFYSAGELQGRPYRDVPHPPVGETLPHLATLVDRGVRVILSHLNHTNPLCDPRSMETHKVTSRGLEVAREGALIFLDPQDGAALERMGAIRAPAKRTENPSRVAHAPPRER